MGKEFRSPGRGEDEDQVDDELMGDHEAPPEAREKQKHGWTPIFRMESYFSDLQGFIKKIKSASLGGLPRARLPRPSPYVEKDCLDRTAPS